MNAADIRKTFIDFFKDKGHEFVRSAPVVPHDDPTLLFTNAGMNQFKPIFLGEQKPKSLRVVNSQKCIRVSGKHNDLEEVGFDTFHHTFFEMLGNWSFGDYYKAEAIAWAWELLTDVWGLDKERLWATVYEEDDEAFELWPQVTDIDSARILKCGKKDNFWEMGETGPCGPCSEIHYYIGKDPSKQSAKGVNNSDEYWELWNLVFIQNNRLDDGTLEDLPAKHVDTGAGLERIVSVLQGKTSNYETDLFTPIIVKTEELTGKACKDNPIPFQVIADHIRMLSFSIADGALPSNEGRGYVLRRILRRAARFGRMLDQHEPFMYGLVETVCAGMGKAFPELIDKQKHIKKVIYAEETSFNETLDRGILHFDKLLKKLKGETIPGEEAFKLYDTYGFPLDLTQLMAQEHGLKVDEQGFNKSMEAQRKRAQESGKFKADMKNITWTTVSEGDDSTFLGYEQINAEASIKRYSIMDGTILLVLDETPFYAESGGQIGDTGSINGNSIDLTVTDVQNENNVFIHYCSGDFDESSASNTVICTVDGPRRQNIRKNHTATHLMHAALKDVLGEHVNQAGSLVHPDYLRFDLTHHEKIIPAEVRQIETIVNREILENTEVQTSIKDFEDARKGGAVAIFGEKYGDTVRVLSIGDFSKELCGGTHVDRTGDIGFFKITEESSLAAGVRRIVALTGPKAVEYVQNQSTVVEELQSKLTSSVEDLNDRVEQLLRQKKDLEKALKQKQKSASSFDIKAVLSTAKKTDGKQIVVHETDAADMDSLKQFGDQLLNELDSGVGVLGTTTGEKPSIVVVVTKDLNEAGVLAPDLAKAIGGVMGGGGGGRPHLATAGGKDAEKFKSAMKQAEKIITEALKG
ncbi:MAG TPA: alanine--tRNA ligase [Candidatus Marinimicrobia bacterium]|jgi:alanyl-tRNA synthetase|nr:alanine--tRNA ligase [Candidatus Neomarinimicrobiota bacterium]HJL75130.1 alanine--tRNA ligase [Candidatus Neomarinimicrobiota bacterium]HJM69253.1 alanine--tRNA ligase [Candidatus Neomarinimicrobiota bacterium]